MGLMDALQDPLFWRDVRRNAKDLGQSASNAALSNVTGPVDTINSLLKLLSMNTDEPMGGSKWAERVGLSRQVPQGAPQVVGETLGLVAPFAGARAPQVANKLLEYTDNAMAPSAANQAARNQLGAIVYHGSPHKFDRFDASKIGTGEGAQAYGHGLYFAESPDVAGKYAKDLAASRQSLTNRGMAGAGGDVDAAIAATQEEIARLKALPNGGGDPQKMMRFVALNEEKLAELAKLKAGQQMSQPNLYKVDLPDNAIARMLDWDKPLSQQAPEVQAAFAKSDLKYGLLQGRKPILDPTDAYNKGEDAYRALAMEVNGGRAMRRGSTAVDASDQKAAEYLKSLGIPGIRYLDAGSRGAGAGTSNYVVFPGEESLLKILERNGMAP